MQKHYIVQISDTHLFGDKNRKINGANSYLNLKNVLNHISVLSEKPDLIVVSGDLSQDCTFESYQHLANLLNKIGIKYYFFPGNHDDVDVINKVVDQSWIRNEVDYTFNFNGWHFYVIDTSIYPEDGGKLTKEQLQKLGNDLKKHENTPSVIFMHHHPVEINSPWMDQMILKESKEFNEVVKQNKNVKAVLFGHIHQVFEKTIDGVFYGSAPSTSFQVVPNTQMFTVENINPGYRFIELNADKFSSKVIRI